MLVTVKYQYKDRNGSLRGKKDIAVKGSGNMVDKATKAILEQFFSERKQPGEIYLLSVELR